MSDGNETLGIQGPIETFESTILELELAFSGFQLSEDDPRLREGSEVLVDVQNILLTHQLREIAGLIQLGYNKKEVQAHLLLGSDYFNLSLTEVVGMVMDGEPLDPDTDAEITQRMSDELDLNRKIRAEVKLASNEIFADITETLGVHPTAESEIRRALYLTKFAIDRPLHYSVPYIFALLEMTSELEDDDDPDMRAIGGAIRRAYQELQHRFSR